MFANSKNPLIQIYALAVCFITIIRLVITIGIALYDVVQVAFPNITYATPFGFSPIKPGTVEYQEALQTERGGAIRSLIQAAIIVGIDTILLIIHWKLAKKMMIDGNVKQQQVQTDR